MSTLVYHPFRPPRTRRPTDPRAGCRCVCSGTAGRSCGPRPQGLGCERATGAVPYCAAVEVLCVRDLDDRNQADLRTHESNRFRTRPTSTATPPLPPARTLSTLQYRTVPHHTIQYHTALRFRPPSSIDRSIGTTAPVLSGEYSQCTLAFARRPQRRAPQRRERDEAAIAPADFIRRCCAVKCAQRCSGSSTALAAVGAAAALGQDARTARSAQ